MTWNTVVVQGNVMIKEFTSFNRHDLMFMFQRNITYPFLRFWFGGDEGNGNNFDDKKTCDQICTDPVGKDACLLPSVPGPCEGYYPRYAYNAKTKSCQSFNYGGCHGNNNRFESNDECEAVCTEDDPDIAVYLVDKCSLPIKPGPCLGNFTR